MRPVEVNAMVKALNSATERPEKHAEHEQELQMLSQVSGERTLSTVEQARLQDLRQDCCNVQARQAEADRLNANPNFIEYEFEVRNGRIVSRQRTPQEMLRKIKQAARG